MLNYILYKEPRKSIHFSISNCMCIEAKKKNRRLRIQNKYIHAHKKFYHPCKNSNICMINYKNRLRFPDLKFVNNFHPYLCIVRASLKFLVLSKQCMESILNIKFHNVSLYNNNFKEPSGVSVMPSTSVELTVLMNLSRKQRM